MTAVKKKRRARLVAPEDALFATARTPRVPFAFVLDALAVAEPVTKPMFGCTAVYVGEQIVLILRDKASAPHDNGVWLATTREHHASLRQDFPAMRSLTIMGSRGETGWQNLPVDSDDFEEAALRACARILAGDPRIGKVPKPRRRSSRRAQAR